MNRLEMGSGFETVQILLHSSVVNAQELVSGGHHVDAIGFAIGAFLIHELVHRLILGLGLDEAVHHYWFLA